MNMLSDEADTFVVWCMRRFEKGETRSRPTTVEYAGILFKGGSTNSVEDRGQR
jgi:hypothetical protein